MILRSYSLFLQEEAVPQLILAALAQRLEVARDPAKLSWQDLFSAARKHTHTHHKDDEPSEDARAFRVCACASVSWICVLTNV